MSSLKELARLMRELDDQLVSCMRCGLCQAVCPLFAATGREADVARGKLALLAGLAQEILKNPQGVQDHVNRCLLCGSCAANCPSGVKVLDIFIKARAILAGYLGLSPAKKLIFRGLLSHPDWFNRILAWGAKFQGIFVKPVDDLLGSSCARFRSPLLSHRHFKPLAPIPWHVTVPRRDTAPGASNLKVAFFVGCLIDKLYPQVGDAVLKVLAHHGVGVHLPAGQGCCGIPALSGGDTQTFRQLVRHNLKRLDDSAAPCDYLVTACATCSATMKNLWPLMMQDAEPAEQERVAALAAKTLDISQFLVDKLGVAPAAAGPGGRQDSPDLSRPLPFEKIFGSGGPAPGPPSGQPRLCPHRDARIRLVLRLRRQLHPSALRHLGGHRQAQTGQHRQIRLPGDRHRLPRLYAANHRHAVPGRAAGPGETRGGDLRRVLAGTLTAPEMQSASVLPDATWYHRRGSQDDSRAFHTELHSKSNFL